MEKKVVGYITSIVPYKENDGIINVLTSDGKFTFKARSILKPTSKNYASCQLFTLGEFVVAFKTEAGHSTLTSATVIKKVKNLIDRPTAATYLSFLTEVISKDESNVGNYFEFFDKTVDLINQGYLDFLTLSLVTLTNLMSNEGIELVADRCLSCDSTEEIETVSYQNGGFLCHDCNLKYKEPLYSIDYLKNFRLVVLATIDDVTKFNVEHKVGLIILNDFFTYIEQYTGISFRYKNILKSIL
jgi:DNA repair protein RecO (recombination protein O)